jgi:hypothetical protein
MPIQTIELDIVTEDHDYSVDAAMASLLEAAQVSPTWRVVGAHVNNWPVVHVTGERDLELIPVLEAYYGGTEIGANVLPTHLTS